MPEAATRAIGKGDIVMPFTAAQHRVDLRHIVLEAIDGRVIVVAPYNVAGPVMSCHPYQWKLAEDV